MTAPTEELRSPLVRRLVEALDDAEQADRAMLTMLRSVSLAETLRLLPPGPPASSLTEERVGEALVQLARLGVGRRPHRSGPGRGPSGGGELDLLTAIEESPLPGQEWVPIADLLGDDLLARLLGISVSSLVRYRRGDRPTPDAVAERLHTVALVCADLSGSYNETGIRRWFGRPRSQLDGRAPSDALTGLWSAHDGAVRRVRDLAASLLGTPVT